MSKVGPGCFLRAKNPKGLVSIHRGVFKKAVPAVRISSRKSPAIFVRLVEGETGWLPDLTRWAAVVAHFLKRGGVFYMVDFHPIVWMFDDRFKNIQYASFRAAPPDGR